MAKKTATTAAVAPAASTAVAQTAPEVNRSQLIRDYKAANPNAKPSEIAKALTKDNMPISATLVGQVLNGRRSGKASKGLQVETLKSAAAFVKTYKGNIDDAAADIETVGKFIDECGGSDLALEALTTFKDISSALS